MTFSPKEWYIFTFCSGVGKEFCQLWLTIKEDACSGPWSRPSHDRPEFIILWAFLSSEGRSHLSGWLQNTVTCSGYSWWESLLGHTRVHRRQLPCRNDGTGPVLLPGLEAARPGSRMVLGALLGAWVHSLCCPVVTCLFCGPECSLSSPCHLAYCFSLCPVAFLYLRALLTHVFFFSPYFFLSPAWSSPYGPDSPSMLLLGISLSSASADLCLVCSVFPISDS